MPGLSLACPQLHPLSLLHTRRILWKTKTQYNNNVTLSPSRSKLTHSNNARNHLYSGYLNLRDPIASSLVLNGLKMWPTVNNRLTKQTQNKTHLHKMK